MSMKLRLPLIVIAFAAILVWAYFQTSFSPFITQTNPMLGDPGKSVYGYSYFYNGDLYHKENFYPLEQLDVIKSGIPGKPGAKRKFTDRRFFYPALANLFTQFTSSVYAFRLLNLAALFTSLFVIFSFSLKLGLGTTAAKIATFLCLFSPSMVAFVGDSSSHLVGNTFFYLWILLLLQVRTGNDGWRRILGMGTLLCLWRTVYPSAGYGGAMFLLLLLHQRAWLKALVPVGALMLFPNAQMELLKSFGIRYGNDTEFLYFKTGLQKQFEQLSVQPLEYVAETARAFVNFLFIDNPIVILLAISTLFLARVKEKGFLFFSLLLPILIVLPVYPASSARGYIVSGSGIIIYTLAGYGIVLLKNLVMENSCHENIRLLRARLCIRSGRLWSMIIIVFFGAILPAFANLEAFLWIASFGLMLALSLFWLWEKWRPFFLNSTLLLFFACQILWAIGGAPPIGLTMPYHSLFRGFFVVEGMGSFMTEQPPPWLMKNYMRATDPAKEIPRSLGGVKDWADFIDLPADQRTMPLLPKVRGPQEGALGNILRIQSLFVMLVVVSALLIVPPPNGLLISLCFLMLWSSAIFWGDRKGFEERYARYQDQAITVQTGQRVEGQLTLSDSFIRKLKEYVSAGDVEQIELYINVTKVKRGRPIFKVWNEEFDIRSENSRRNNMLLSPSEFLSRLKQHRNTITFSLEFEGAPDGQTFAGSWQHIGTDSARSVRLVHAEGTIETLKDFPAFEIRLRDRRGYFHLIGL